MANFLNIDELKNEVDSLKQDSVLKFKIMVNANAKNNSMEFLEEYIKIRIKEKPVEGKANKAIIEYLSDVLNIAKSKIEIISGTTSKIKTVAIKN